MYSESLVRVFFVGVRSRDIIHSFIHSFICRTNISVICALLEEGGKEDGDDDFDDAREQQHA